MAQEVRGRECRLRHAGHGHGQYLAQGGSATEGAYLTCPCGGPVAATPQAEAFEKDYKAEYKVASGTYSAEAFDAALGASLRTGRPAVDADLARELWASTDAIVELAELDDLGEAQVDYDDAPYGVQYWVMRWNSES